MLTGFAMYVLREDDTARFDEGAAVQLERLERVPADVVLSLGNKMADLAMNGP
jgi:hypothetical protein